MTRLDTLHPGEDAGEPAWRAFWSAAAAAELHLWLEAESAGGTLTPRLFDVAGQSYALAFDREDRLAAFAGGPAPYAALPGRRLAALLAQSGLGLGLNFGAPSETLADPDVVAWLAEMGRPEPEAAEARPVELGPPTLAPDLVAALDARLAAAEGLARRAWLAAAAWEDGRRSHLLAVEEAVEGAAGPIARFVAEALAFAGAEVALDVTAVVPGSGLAERLARVGLGFDLPERPAPQPPGLKPPRLR